MDEREHQLRHIAMDAGLVTSHHPERKHPWSVGSPELGLVFDGISLYDAWIAMLKYLLQLAEIAQRHERDERGE